MGQPPPKSLQIFSTRNHIYRLQIALSRRGSLPKIRSSRNAFISIYYRVLRPKFTDSTAMVLWKRIGMPGGGSKTSLRENMPSMNLCDSYQIDQFWHRIYQTTGGHISPLSIAQVDELLDELASTSGYTHESIRKKYPQATRRSRLSILKILFRGLSPIDASFLTQIILKDLRPILYPLRETHYTTALLDYNAASVKMLIKEHAMTTWDPTKWMLNAYRVKSTIEEAANSFELPPNERGPIAPQIGIPVAVIKSQTCCGIHIWTKCFSDPEIRKG